MKFNYNTGLTASRIPLPVGKLSPIGGQRHHAGGGGGGSDPEVGLRASLRRPRRDKRRRSTGVASGVIVDSAASGSGVMAAGRKPSLKPLIGRRGRSILVGAAGAPVAAVVPDVLVNGVERGLTFITDQQQQQQQQSPVTSTVSASFNGSSAGFALLSSGAPISAVNGGVVDVEDSRRRDRRPSLKKLSSFEQQQLPPVGTSVADWRAMSTMPIGTGSGNVADVDPFSSLPFPVAAASWSQQRYGVFDT